MLNQGSSLKEVANVLDCNVEVSEFELYSHYYVPFVTNTCKKGVDLFKCQNSSILSISV